MSEHVWLHGIFNVEKCVKYLRSVGVEISAETEAQWLDAQKAHRFLRGMKRIKREGWDYRCENGHMNYVEFTRPRRDKTSRKCATCGGHLSEGWARWWELRDGTLRDHRRPEYRWRGLRDPLPDDGEPPLRPWESV